MINIRKIYYKYFSISEGAWIFFLKDLISNCDAKVSVLKDWEHVSRLHFTPERHTQLLQLSFVKNWHDLSEYLLDNKTFIYPFSEIPVKQKFSKIHFLDGFMTDNLLHEDHAAWLALMACHHPLHLLGLDKDYNFEDYYYIARKFFLHNSFKPIYTDKNRRELILSRCPTSASKMLAKIFLEMDLSLSTKPRKVVKI